MKNVIGPKVLQPVNRWYTDNVDGDPNQDAGEGEGEGEEQTTDEATTPPADLHATSTAEPGPAPTSGSLASAQAAEAFFAGPDAGELPPAASPGETAEPGTATAEEDDGSSRGLAATAVATGHAVATKTAQAAVDIPRTRAARIKDIGLRVKDRVKEHNLAVVAAGIAFWGLLAIPAVLTAVLSIYGLVADASEVEAQIENNLEALPEEARAIIIGQLESVAGASGGGLAVGAVVGILLALWTSSGATAKIIATLNTIWGVPENRPFLKLRGLALFITLGSIVFVVGAAFLLAILPAVLSEAGFADAGRWMLNTGRFPALLVFMAFGLAVLYWIGPNRRMRYRPLTWGAVLATLLWVLVSAAFSIYTARFSSYNETYGTLGAIVILLMWLFLTAFVVLIGAEIDASREEADAEAAAAEAA